MTYQSLPHFDEVIVIDDPKTGIVELNARGRCVTVNFENDIEMEQFYIALDEMDLMDIEIPKNLEFQVLKLVLEEDEIQDIDLESRLCHLRYRDELAYLWRVSGYSRESIFDDGLRKIAEVNLERWIRDGVVIATDSGWTLTKIGRALKTLFYGVRKKGGNGFFVSVHVS